ncbi:Sec23-binding domain of Sec16-domain-containing protein [Melampsora americana]|nr:Sec23-binding domain of Sec16-domain-containing protein [Melampsora americana]
MSTDQPPLSFNNSNTSTTPNHQARKPSIGDASQLFGGGGSGLDDFFGTSSFSTHPSQSPGVATLHEEPDSFHPTDSSHNVRNGSFDNLYGVNNPVSSSINPAPYGVPHQLPSAAYPHSYAAPSPPTHHYNPNMTQSSADVYNNYAQASYVPNPIHGAENIPNQADTAYSHYSHHSQSNTYAEQTYGHDLHTTGLGISNAPLHSVNNAIPPYPESNPYAPSQLHDNSSTYHPTSSHESPIFNPYDTIPHLSGHIPRSASVGYQPNHDSLNTSSQFLSHSHNQNSSTLSHQSSTASFTRPKGFDAYDPPPIRKKKHMAPSTTGSLPSSPALGYGQTNQFGTANFGSPGTQTPPPPPKQRSISGPAQAPIIPGSETYTSPYLPSDEAYHFDPYNPNPSLPYATPTYPSNTDHDPYAQPIQSQNIDHRAPVGQNDGSYQGSTSKDIVQRPDDPYAPNNGATVDAYRSTYGVLPNTNGRESPLSTNRSITSSPPMTSHTPDSIPSSTSPKPGQSPSSPTGGNSMAVPFDRKPKRSSPLKTAVSANEDSDSMSSFNAPLIEEPNGVTHPTTPSTEEDLLIEATQKLTLHTANLQCAIETAPSGEAAVSLPEVSQKQSWSASDHVPQKDNSSSSFMTVPAVLIQPATPEMTISGIPEPSPNQTNFDVLADLDQGSVTRSSSNMDHDSYAYDYSTGGTTGPDNSAYDYSLNQTYDQKYQGTHERPQQTFDIYRPPSVSNNVNVPSYYDSYAPTEGQHASDENPYNHSVPLAQGSIGQQNPVGDQYLSHYQPNAPIPSGEPSTRPSSRMLVSESPHLMTSNEAQSYTPSSHYQPASSTDRDGDPSLHRLKAKIPLASFGFGGKLLVVFPSGGQAPSFTSAGYEDPYTSAAKASTGTTLQIHQLSQVIPSIELQAFPGPLFMEGGSKSSVVKKKKEITQWLDERLDETEKECGYLQSNTKTLNTDAGALEAHALKAEQVQDKLLVLKLLKIMIENEGKLSGSPKVDEAVRIALKSVSLRSPTEKTSPSSLPVESLIFEPGLSTPSVSHPSPSDTVATYTVSASNLDRIQALLSHGDRPNALKFASEQKMWAHALVVANSLGHDTWRETVREFVRYELGITISSGSSSTSDSQSNGRESLRALYSLFAGAGPAAMEEFIPPTILSGNSMARSSPSLAPNPYGIAMAVPPSASNSRASSPAPINKPEFRHPTVKLPNETLNQWRTTVALTIANRVPGTTPFLSSLGDTLLSNNRVYAGHACHLLSNGLSPIVGMENGTRISLLGCHMQTSNAGPGLVEAVMLTEVLEFALSLAVVSKGQDTFIGIPHIQGFKLALAYEYATSGSVTIAQKYCESTAAIIKLATKPCPFYHSTLTDQIKALSDRLSAAPVPEKGSSWISRKMPRPTLDNVWQSLEGRVHKFVAGDDEGNTESGNNGPAGLTLPNQAIGPFSHYSSISPASSSGTLSRAQSSSDLRFGVPSFSGPFQHGLSLQRPASGGGFSSSTSYERDPRQRSTSALVTGYSSSDWYSHAEDDDSNPATITQPLLTDSQQNLGDDSSKTATPTTVVPAGGGGGGGGGWWEAAASTGGTPSGSVPPVTFTTFDAGSTPIAADDGSGFIDPMASFGIPSFSTSNNGDFTNYRDDSSKAAYNDDDDDDDLGLGNNNRKKEKSGGGNRGDDDEDPASSDKNGAENQKPTGSSLKPDDKSLKPSPSSSWIGRWFKRDAAAPTNGGPVKANLGEEVSLVYDPETKRWVSRKPGQASTSSSPNTPPPPPARAQTASPTSAMRPPSNGAYPPPPPISRSMTNMPSGTNPPPPSQHRLSQPTTYLKNSNSTSDMGSTQSTSPPPVHVSENAPPSTSSGLPPPPTLTGSKKPATKKSIKSRYVEIR